jgi:hypothetical protein
MLTFVLVPLCDHLIIVAAVTGAGATVSFIGIKPRSAGTVIDVGFAAFRKRLILGIGKAGSAVAGLRVIFVMFFGPIAEKLLAR